ncbi:hypothetical protein PAXINDRAFT_102637 [Paxillus involutus ATCC 200175]|uniref:L-tryptophan decarboxylase PsiD-like domain-containing protein n=1 Tax=Paxillus involutus ATCC 200175 TaxID=664439 RepID=A0A0C9TK95_PAXIN|nr:hypothetical protein PAXINDRAFT_102637 [Paxillus involutus ATCC 200175]
MAAVPKTKLSRYGGWLPSANIHKSFLDYHTKLASERLKKYRTTHPNLPRSGHLPGGAEGPYVPSVQAFADAINANPVMGDLFDQILLQASPMKEVVSFDELLFMLDGIVVKPPPFHRPEGEGEGEPIGVPIYLMLDLLINTSAAYDLFRMDEFNVAIKALLKSWGDYLADTNPLPPLPPSNSSLNSGPDGWFSERGLLYIEAYLSPLTFKQTYYCPDPSADNLGFRSWDEFFVREFQRGVRPVDEPGNNSLIHNACESTVYNKAEKVKLHDQFWLKDQKYSLYDMFGVEGNAYAEKFVDGTVYQAFLSPADYHRWHSPVNGTVLDAFVIPGTYYAALPDAGADADDPERDQGDPHGALIRSQGWLTVAAARAVIFIQAEEPIGLMCFIGVGMVEVSTCQLLVKQGDVVEKGTQLGMFHFGGSTHTLIFGPHIKVTWADVIQKDTHHWINSIIGKAELVQ